MIHYFNSTNGLPVTPNEEAGESLVKQGLAIKKEDCPADPNKQDAGQCGCGVADTDNDADGTANCNDICDNDADDDLDGDGYCADEEECDDDDHRRRISSIIFEYRR